MKLNVDFGERGYDIIIEAGGLARLGEFVNLKRKVMVIRDGGVPCEYVQRVLDQCESGFSAVVPQGEGSKSLKTFGFLLGELLKYGFGRGDLVVAVGGGVVGDLAGYVASSYMRGIDFVNCPTTTLSQIDSSIGGKVAVNLQDEFGTVTKNVVGAFYQPKLVLIDTDTLKTLPKRHFVAGLAEAIKAGLIYDAKLFEMFEDFSLDDENMDEKLVEILYSSLSVKKAFVEEDECETGVRAALNFGHTIGHGIESANLGELYHGECVALGMLPMISEDLKPRLLKIYENLGLPTRISYDGDEIFEIMKHDKKAKGENMKVVRVDEIGKYYFDTVPTCELRAVIGDGIK